MGLIVAALLVPFKQVWPKLFELVNTYRSSTLSLRDRIHAKYVKAKKGMYRRRDAALKTFRQRIESAKNARSPHRIVPAIEGAGPAVMRAKPSLQIATFDLPHAHTLEQPPTSLEDTIPMPLLESDLDSARPHRGSDDGTAREVFSYIEEPSLVGAVNDERRPVESVRTQPSQKVLPLETPASAGAYSYDDGDMSLDSFVTAQDFERSMSGDDLRRRVFRIPKLEATSEAKPVPTRESVTRLISVPDSDASGAGMNSTLSSPSASQARLQPAEPHPDQLAVRPLSPKLKVAPSRMGLMKFTSAQLLADVDLSADVDDPYRFDPWLWALLSVASILQTFSGFYIAAQGVYLAATNANRTVTVAVLVVTGALLFCCGLAGFVSVKSLRSWQAVAFIVLSIGAEAGGVSLMEVYSMADREMCYIIIGSVQVMGVLVAVASVLWIMRSRTRALEVKRQEKLLVEKLKVEVKRQQRRQSLGARAMLASKKLARAMRNYRLQIMRNRSEELDMWNGLAVERRILRAMVYLVLVVVMATCAYFNLLYGVVFTSAQNSQWISAVFTALLMGAFFTFGLLAACTDSHCCLCLCYRLQIAWCPIL
jgi:hypothetical protein